MASESSATYCKYSTFCAWVRMPILARKAAARCSPKLLLALKHQLPAQIRSQHLHILDVFRGACEDIRVQHDQVRQLAFLERAGLVVDKHDAGVVNRVESDRLLAAQCLLGMELALVPLGPARNRG